MVRVKICGITSVEDALVAARAGADALGLNFIGGPRRIAPSLAERILSALPPFCVPVPLVDVSGGGIPADLRPLLDRFRIARLQLYGALTGDIMRHLVADGFTPLLVHSVRPGQFPQDVNERLAEFADCPPRALLLDAPHPTLAGGTGQTADWAAIAAARSPHWPPLVLAGGLNPANVAAAIATVRPWAVDVSSGVESAPGHKDAALVRLFVQNAKAAAAAL